MYTLNVKKTGVNIHNEMIRQNISVKYVAHVLKISQSAVYKWLRGLSAPDVTHLYVLGKTLNVPIEALIAVENKDL